MRFTGRFINEGAGFSNPIVFQVPPVTTHRIPANDAHTVMHAEFGAGQTFQDSAESSGRDIETTRLNPREPRLRDPRTFISQVGGVHTVTAVSLVGVEPVD